MQKYRIAFFGIESIALFSLSMTVSNQSPYQTLTFRFPTTSELRLFNAETLSIDEVSPDELESFNTTVRSASKLDMCFQYDRVTDTPDALSNLLEVSTGNSAAHRCT